MGAVTVVVDTLMAALSPQPTISTACFSLILTSMFFSLSGYLASALAGNPRQGIVAGLIAALVVGLVDPVTLQLLPGQSRGIMPWLEGAWYGLSLNVPFGVVFGYIGGRFGARQS
ncbi:MAG: hypothetical protein M3Q29_01190 [Chloroflexota bacterium]|nr:hypothetical protein [Chloroflexota bacterium]